MSSLRVSDSWFASWLDRCVPVWIKRLLLGKLRPKLQPVDHPVDALDARLDLIHFKLVPNSFDLLHFELADAVEEFLLLLLGFLEKLQVPG
jgi:hypothetical protein